MQHTFDRISAEITSWELRESLASSDAVVV